MPSRPKTTNAKVCRAKILDMTPPEKRPAMIKRLDAIRKKVKEEVRQEEKRQQTLKKRVQQIFKEFAMAEQSIDKCEKIPISKAIVPFTGAQVWVDYYWVVVDECLLFYKKTAPQCNSNKGLTEKVRDSLYPGAEVRKIPLVYGIIHY